MRSCPGKPSVGAVLLACGVVSGVARADADGKKDVTWQFVSARGGAGIVGNWSAYARAAAACQHGKDGPHENDAGANGQGTWPAMTGFSGPWITDSAIVPHANSTANIRMSAGAAFEEPGGVAPQGFTRYNAVLTKDWSTRLNWGADFIPTLSYARVHGESSLNAGSALRYQLTGNVEGAAIRPREGRGDGKGLQVVKTKNGHTATWRDPIFIQLTNDRTGESLSEELFRFDLMADFADDSAGWTVAGETMTLRAGGGETGNWLGSISITGAANSSWLLNPLGEFGASLTGGLFAASGYWANLWQVQTDAQGRAIAATINLSDLNWNLQYMIPDSVMNDTDSYTRVLSVIEDYEEQGGDVIPAPASLALLGLWCAVSRARRR